ncbi:MAG: hypothetical protein ACRDYF_03895 [Acidimicrobiia bacterium]
MSPPIHEFRMFEGRQVCVALADGSRIDDCSLVSAGRGRAQTVWVFVNGIDVFIRPADVTAVWEAASYRRQPAA